MSIERRYWDSNCFVAILNADEAHSSNCVQILDEAARGNLEIVVSTITMVEVVRPRGTGSPVPREIEDKITAFFENDYIRMRLVDRLVAEKSRQLCWSENLHPRDAVHVATAILESCEVLESSDPHLLRLNGRIPNLEIRVPTWTGQTDLFKPS